MALLDASKCPELPSPISGVNYCLMHHQWGNKQAATMVALLEVQQAHLIARTATMYGAADDPNIEAVYLGSSAATMAAGRAAEDCMHSTPFRTVSAYYIFSKQWHHDSQLLHPTLRQQQGRGHGNAHDGLSRHDNKSCKGGCGGQESRGLCATTATMCAAHHCTQCH
jgi:hypothetical protein